jgi:hypothetical protein
MGSHFPLSYVLSWPFAYLRPSTGGHRDFHGTTRKPTSQIEESAEVRLMLLGDLLCAQGDRIPLVDRALGDLLSQADRVIFNCESPILGESCDPHAGYRFFRHDMPLDYVRGFLERLHCEPANVVFSLANNHILDHGLAGFDGTLSACHRLGATVIGLRSAFGALTTILEIRGFRLGIVAWTHWLNRRPRGNNLPICTQRDILDTPWHRVIKEEGLDALVGLPHWDREFRHFPQPATRKLARHLANQGFYALVGCHPHVIQPAEWIDDTLCVYSLGSLNGPAMPIPCWPAQLGVLAELTFGQDGLGQWRLKDHEFHPFVQSQENGQLRISLLETLPVRTAARYRARNTMILGTR